MKRKVVLVLSFLSLGMLLSSPQFADTSVSISGSADSHEEVLSLNEKTPLLDKKTNLGNVLSSEGESAETLHADKRGIGYYWKCHTCGYNSAWHLLASTAVSAANKHAQQNNHVTSVFPN